MRQPRPVHQIKDQQDLLWVRGDDPNFSGTLAKGLMILQVFVNDPRAYANSEIAARLGCKRPANTPCLLNYYRVGGTQR